MKKKYKTITINSREWILKTHKSGWSNFNTYDKNGNGCISINIGKSHQPKSNRSKLEVIIHEIIEAILTDDYRRWVDKVNDSRVLFCFDHDYLNEFETKLLTALISCGMVDPDKRII